MESSRPNGLLALILDYAAGHESFESVECAAAIGRRRVAVTRALSKMVKRGRLFAYGPLNCHKRRYTLSREIAQAYAPEPEYRGPNFDRKRMGAVMGGIDSMDDVRMRCHHERGCLIWDGAFSNKDGRRGIPSAQLPNGKTGSVVRFVWTLTNTKELRPEHMIWRKCQDNRCVEPRHLLCGSRQEYGVWLRETGAWKGRQCFVDANAASGAKRAVITRQLAAQIIESGEPHRDWARKLGVHLDSVSRALSRYGMLKRKQHAKTPKPVEMPAKTAHVPTVRIADGRPVGQIIIPPEVKITKCPSFTHDARYQVKPGASVPRVFTFEYEREAA